MNLVRWNPRALLRCALPTFLLLAAPACADKESPTFSIPEDVVELRGPDGSRAVFRVAADAREPLLWESLSIPDEGMPLEHPDGARGNVLVAVAAGALTVYSAYEVIRICVPAFVEDWVLRRTILNLRTKEACFEQAAVSIVSKGVATKVIPPVKVTAVRNSIKQMLGNVFTNRQLQNVFNRRTKPKVTELVRDLHAEVYQKLYDGFKGIFNDIRR